MSSILRRMRSLGSWPLLFDEDYRTDVGVLSFSVPIVTLRSSTPGKVNPTPQGQFAKATLHAGPGATRDGRKRPGAAARFFPGRISGFFLTRELRNPA